MTTGLSDGDRNVHIEAVIKSNIITFGLSVEAIDSITANLTADIIDVLNNYDQINKWKLTEEELNSCG